MATKKVSKKVTKKAEKKAPRVRYTTCPDCGGSGLDPADFSQHCSTCKGSGKVKA